MSFFSIDGLKPSGRQTRLTTGAQSPEACGGFKAVTLAVLSLLVRFPRPAADYGRWARELEGWHECCIAGDGRVLRGSAAKGALNMKVRIPRVLLTALQIEYPACRDWKALEAPSRTETNDLKRAGYRFIVEKNGLQCYAKENYGS